ncbi:MAG: response regulator [Xanthomonadales bacterium]|nr:response regulator [Xanthomonadales bacterium]
MLVIDDDRDFLESLGDMLEMGGNYSTCLARDAVSAVAMAQAHLPAIALIDVKLGQDNGLELLPILKRTLPGMVCIVMTAFRDEKHSRQAFESGAEAFLHKPIDPNRLFLTMQDLLVHSPDGSGSN